MKEEVHSNVTFSRAGDTTIGDFVAVSLQCVKKTVNKLEKLIKIMTLFMDASKDVK